MSRNQEFVDALEALITEHWEDLKPSSVDDIDELTLTEMGDSYPSCWVLVLGASSIGNADASHMTIRLAPRGQLPFTGIGLLEDATTMWKGSE